MRRINSRVQYSSYAGGLCAANPSDVYLTPVQYMRVRTCVYRVNSVLQLCREFTSRSVDGMGNFSASDGDLVT